MLQDLIKQVGADNLKSFMKQTGMKQPAKYDIAEKNMIITKESAITMSKVIASIHTAFNILESASQNINSIEKAKLRRADSSTKENYMEARLPRDVVRRSESNVEIGGIVKTLAGFNNLLEDLDEALKKLDLSCNVCVEPCDIDIDDPRRRRRRRRRRTGQSIGVGVPRRVPAARAAEAASRSRIALPTSERIATKAPQLQYKPLPDGEELRRQTAPREKVRVQEAASSSKVINPTDRTAQGRTVAEAEVFKGTEGKTPAEIRAMRREARMAEPVRTQLPTQQSPKSQSARQRWTSSVPKEQYFEQIRANQNQDTFARAARAPAGAPKASAPGTFNKVVTGIAESKATRVGGRVLGVAGTAADVYTRKQAGQSWAQVGAGVGGGLAGAYAGGTAGAAAGGAIGAAFGGIGAVPGAFIGGLIGSGLGYFGGSALGDKAYEKLQNAKPVSKPAPQSKINERAAAKATKDLVQTTKKITQKPKVAGTETSVFAGFASMADKFATFIRDTIQSITSYVMSLPSMLSGLGRGIGDFFGDLGGGFNEGLENLTPAGSSAHAEQAMQYFMGRGWSRAQAAGIVGNLQVESSKNLDPNSIRQNDAGPGLHSYGIAQWNRGRFANLQRFARDRGTSWNDFNTQLAFVQYELTTGEKKGVGNALRGISSAEEAAAFVDARYEVSTGAARRQRMANARALAGGDSFATQIGRAAGQAAAYLGGMDQAFVDTVRDVPGNFMDYFNVPANVQLSGVNPTFLRRLKAMGAEYKRLTGQKIGVASAFRDRSLQERLYNLWRAGRGNPAAPPGSSRHESGLAIDLDRGQADWLERSGLMRKYGLHRPDRRESERQHVEPIEGARLASLPDNPYRPGAPITAAGKGGQPVVIGTGGKAKTVATAAAASGPTRGGYLADIASGAAARRRAASGGVKYVVIPAAAPAVPGSIMVNRGSAPAATPPSSAGQYRWYLTK